MNPCPPPALTAQLASLPTLPLASLWHLWDQHFARRPQRVNRRLLEARLAYRLQEVALGGLPARIREHLADCGEQHSKIKTARLAAHKPGRGLERRFMPGTTLVREWEGDEYRVTVTLDGGYELNGVRFRSLSAVARSITGTHWSGPRFFGLEGR